MSDYNIDPKKNYQRRRTDHVFTGQQVLNLLELSSPAMQAVILLDIQETDLPATDPKSKYGPLASDPATLIPTHTWDIGLSYVVC